MSDTTLLKRDHLRPGDLPTLQKAFNACERELLKRVIIEDFACREACVDDARRQAMERRLDATLDAMASLHAEKRPNKGWVLMPRETYVLDARSRTLSWRLHAALVLRYDISVAERFVRESGGCTTSYARARKADKRLRALVRDVRGARGGEGDEDDWGERNYALAPWEDTLGTRLWIGREWCRRERYLTLASAFWEMTFYGFEYDRMQARAAQEKAARLMGAARDDVAKDSVEGAAGRGSLRSRSGPRRSDRCSNEALEHLARRVAVLNHNARCAFFEQALDLAQRMERS